MSFILSNFDLLTRNPEHVEQLKQLVLQLAVRGKWVPQDQQDEPAPALLERIKEEKARLVKEGKIKKSKPLPPVGEEEVPYELPEGWVWCRLGLIQNFVNGYAFKSSSYVDNGIGIVRIGDIQNGSIVTTRMKKVGNASIEGLDYRLKVFPGDLLIAMSGATTGKLGFNKSNNIFYLNQRVGKLDLIKVDKFFLYFILSTKVKENLDNSIGSAIPNLSTKEINNIPIPLPPLPEQHRIVQKSKYLIRTDRRHGRANEASPDHPNQVAGHLASSPGQCLQ